MNWGEVHLHWWWVLAALGIMAGVLSRATRARLATAGPYARIRHPQYVGFIMFGFLVQWPTLMTLVMFPVLVTMYALLARREEAESETEFGDARRA
jgi:methanethiol S-methyltransferase